MEEMTLHNRLVIDSIRLCNLLSQNLLVQSNAIAQRIESILDDELKLASKVEDHKYFKAYKHANAVKSLILSGRTGDALAGAELLKTEIQKV